MDDFISPEQITKQLSREQKIGFVLLLIFGILAVALAAFQIRNTMYGPFALNTSMPADLSDAVNDPNSLRYRDTDNDGLSDFDELYVYGTSPYLKDTNSDGVDDKTSILRGIDPVCPKGQSCGSYIASASAAGGGASSNTINNIFIPKDPGAVPDFMQQIQDPRKVREMILSSGAVDKALLDQIPDDVLMKAVYEQTKTSFQALGIPFTPQSGAVSTTASSTTSSLPAASFTAPTTTAATTSSAVTSTQR